MQRIVLSLLLGSLLLYCFSQEAPLQPPASILSDYKSADKIYQRAEQLAIASESDESLVETADQEYLRAARLFLQLLPAVQRAGNDSLAFFIQLKSGLVQHYFDSLELAKKLYLGALEHKNRIRIADSFYFKPSLFTGSILYRQDKMDSALLYLRRAEQINTMYQGRLDGSERLFNLFGVIHYETGNYRQAVNYFEKALALLAELNPAEKSLRANYKINIGSTLMKIEEYAAAKKIFEEVLTYNVFNNELFHKLGLISIREKDFPKATDYLRKVSYPNSKKLIDLNLNFAMAFDGSAQPDSAEQYLHQALAENLKWNGHRKNISYGLILKYQADTRAGKGLYKEALPLYQQAIVQFDNQFNEQDPLKNPEQFSGVFSYINLFNTLTAKADLLEKMYEQDKKTATLETALATYRSAFMLADYVERSYNSDEARLFLGRIKHDAHSRPIAIGLRLFKLTKKKEYLEEVYFFDQRNKATVLSLNLKMQELASSGRIKDDLFSREIDVKTAITRLSLKSASETDSLQLSELNARIRDYEIELERIREEINQDPERRELLAAEKIPSVRQLHRMLDNTTAILSFHLAEEELLILVITSSKFEYYQVPINLRFFKEVETLRDALHNTSQEYRYGGSVSAARLYKQLFSPILPSLVQSRRLIIIPDDELHYLPFEVLEDEKKNYLLQKFSIQYQYSTALLGNKPPHKMSKRVLSFAPFYSAGYQDSVSSLSKLPSSGEEAQQLNGLNLLDNAASKSNFLLSANRYNVIHLATHASADNKDPLQSFISFYPGNRESRLYAREIYDLQLDTTSLVILSACETGKGKLVKGEGLMSLSRAFAYAGCPNIITSLWKAEDRVTAFITQRLHYYLGKNETKDKALQLAKTDLLNNPDIEPGLKTPNYWAPLVLIGDYEADHKRSNWSFVAIGIVLTLLAYYYYKKKNLPVPGKRQADVTGNKGSSTG